MPDNGKPETGLYQIHAGVKIVNRNNTPRRPDSKIRLKYRGINSKIPLALSDPQTIRNVIKDNKNESNGNNRDKKNFPPVRRSTPIISLVPYEGKRANVGSANQDQIRRERAFDLFRAGKNSELEKRLTTNEEK
jgi:hypothetical protein